MNDNILIAAIISALNSGLASIGQGSILVQQDFQPTQQGTPTAPTVFLHKIGDVRFGGVYRNNQWNDSTIAAFTASISGTTMTVTAVSAGTIAVGQTLQGTGIPNNILIVGLGTNTTGGIGTYIISQPLTIGSESLTTIAGMGYTETQQYMTTFQFSALATQDPSNVASLTASDIVNYAAAIMQSLTTIQTLQAQNIGILKIGDIRNPAFSDDRQRYEYSPSFDVTFTTKQVISSVQPIITETVLQVEEI